MSNLSSRFLPHSRTDALRWIAILVTLISVARICASYHSLSITWDEPSHVACGMEWIDQGKYTYETLHPPVSRVAIALLPYISGVRSQGEANEWPEGNKIFYDGAHYWQTLTLARLGILPFYIFSVFLLWSWSKKMFGDEIALLSVLFYTLIPPVLAHAGLATTDFAFSTAFLAACYALWLWLKYPNRNRSLVLGLAIGLGFATKFSFLAFFPPAAIVIVGYEFFVIRNKKPDSTLMKKMGVGLVFASFSAILSLWACYRFSYGPLPNTAGPSYPMPELWDGISVIMAQNKFGRAVYFMGQAQHGHASIWFFPVAIALKTPIAFLLLTLAGSALIFFRKNAIKTREYLKSYQLLPLIISAMVLAIGMKSHFNLGVRHIIHIYPFLAMLAALGALWLFRLPKPFGKAVLGLIVLWMVVSSFSAGNDHLAYFNEFAGPNPEHFLIVSDLDWGQDLTKLSDTLRANNVQFVSLNYNGSAELERAALPRYEFLSQFTVPNAPWVAISMEPLYIFDGYKWLLDEIPYRRIGNSTLLFHFSDEDLTRIRSMLSFNGSLGGNDLAHAASIASSSHTADSYLDLSLSYYKAERYRECIAAARKAIALKPDYSAAYNNICVAFNQLGLWDSAVPAGNQAVRFDPTNQLAKNNLKWATDHLNKK